MSAVITRAPSTWMLPSTDTGSSSPWTVGAVVSPTTSAAVTRPGTTW